MESQKLSLLAYTSIASHHMTHEELNTLLAQSYKNNRAVDITGMLLYMEGCFFQVLEGNPEQLEKLYEKIAHDPRHHNIMKLIFEPIETHTFSNWVMGYQHVTREELSNITGLTDFLDRANSGFDSMEASRARELIEFFREGRWFRKDLTHYKRISMGT